MIVVDVLTGGRPLAPDRQHRLAARLTSALLAEDALEDGTAEARRSMEGARALTTVSFTEASTWTSGGRPVDEHEPTRYVVRVSVPEAWHGEFAPHAIRAISDVLAAEDAEPERFEREPHAVIHVLGVPEDGCGLHGRQVSSSDIVRLVTADAHAAGGSSEAPPGSVIDPICGMVVRLGPDALTLTHDGVTYGFCATGCRRVFAEDRGIDLAA